jgi:hypothetical protein
MFARFAFHRVIERKKSDFDFWSSALRAAAVEKVLLISHPTWTDGRTRRGEEEERRPVNFQVRRFSSSSSSKMRQTECFVMGPLFGFSDVDTDSK